MKVKAHMQVICQLSDAQECISMGRPADAKAFINFAKFIIMQCEGDLKIEIDVDETYYKFLNRFAI